MATETESKIRKRLEILELTQWDLSKDLGIHPSYLNRIVSGTVTPNAERATQIARALGTTVEDIWGGAA